ncbi:MAG: hypothetical protein Q8N37_00855, partial [bacterium]|nr:hypothetical protein [bacterium]
QFSQLTKSLAFIVSVLAISLSLSYFVLAWTEPTVAPPSGNVATPLNVGATGQTKSGGLWLNTSGAANGLIVDKGNVGIGTNAPGAKLDVVGGNVRSVGTILVPQSLEPVSPVEGQMYYDSVSKTIKIFNGSVWMLTSASEERLAGGLHTPAQCSASGGSVFTFGADKFCRFSGASCPSTWVQYRGYSTTVGASCNSMCNFEDTRCTTSSHTWSDNGAIETCSYASVNPRGNNYACLTSTCTASRTEIGCY